VLPDQIVTFVVLPEAKLALNLEREALLGTRRRIEITAFRRATIVFRPQAGNDFGSGPPVETERSGPVGFDSSQAGEVDPADAQLMTVANSSELKLIIDALVKHDGDVARAAKQLGLSRNDFLLKLCGIGLSIE
jgi:DNA-binding NtrC family response regulator